MMRYLVRILPCLAALFLWCTFLPHPCMNSGPALTAAEKHTHGQGGEECQECKKGEGSSEHHHHGKTGDKNNLPEVHSGLDHGDDHDDCQTCTEYFGEPWRKALEFSGWMRVKIYKVLLFAFLCYLYLKRRALLNLFRRKAKN